MQDAPTGNSITIGEILVQNDSDRVAGQVYLSNAYRPNQEISGQITIGSIKTENIWGGGAVAIDSIGGVELISSIDTSSSDISQALGVTDRFFIGNGGDISIIAKGDITLHQNSQIISRGLNSGQVRIQGTGSLTLDQSNIRSNFFLSQSIIPKY